MAIVLSHLAVEKLNRLSSSLTFDAACVCLRSPTQAAVSSRCDLERQQVILRTLRSKGSACHCRRRRMGKSQAFAVVDRPFKEDAP
jgi:hypothetical protein